MAPAAGELADLLKRAGAPLLVAGIVLIALNLRPAITSVGPLSDEIGAGLGLSSAGVGLLTTLPLLAFGAVSPFAARIALRFGMELTLGAALVVMAAAIALRSAGGAPLAFVATTVAGAAITAGNVLLPGLVKDRFPDDRGAMTSLYVTAMVGLAGVASAVSVPLADDAGLGWRGALAFWALPVAAAFAVWLPQMRERHVPDAAEAHTPLPWRSPLAWRITAFMGLQSLIFFGLVAWLPELLRDAGLSASTSGLMVGVMQFGGLAATIGVPVLAMRRGDQRPHVAWSCAACAVGLAGLLAAPAELPGLWALLLGLSTGAFLSLALTFFVVRARAAADTAALSGMAQAGGYLIAAAGPAGIGALHDLSGGWTLPVWTLLGVTALTFAFGLGAGRDRLV